ncbi:MAG: serine hydrolase domain-containing protein, partial [Pseudomonadota bacterium]
MNVFRIAILLVAGWLAAPAALSQTIDYERLDSRLALLAADEEIVGLAVAVVENGEVSFAKGYGVTRLGDGAPVTDQTVFRWASLSKGVASTTAVRLATEGRLSLTDTIASFDTSLRLPGGGETRATLENVLSHMIGIVPNAYDTRLEDGRDPVDIRRALGRLRATCAVGECHTYQNVAYDAVSEAIETRTGLSYAETVSNRIFEPLEMITASFGRAAL